MSTLRDLVESVPDPELPHVTIGELGIVRGVEEEPDGSVRIEVTPTYTGCPAVEAIEADILTLLSAHGYPVARVVRVLEPAWTTDAISALGREKLRSAGIAPPPPVGAGLAVAIDAPVECPRCGSRRTRRRSDFGSTPCQAVYVCGACSEPFQRFKPL